MLRCQVKRDYMNKTFSVYYNSESPVGMLYIINNDKGVFISVFPPLDIDKLKRLICSSDFNMWNRGAPVIIGSLVYEFNSYEEFVELYPEECI